MHIKWNENILELKSFIKTYDVPSEEISIQQQDKIELTKMHLMVEEAKEYSLKKSVSGLEESIVKKKFSKYNNAQSQTSKALDLTDRIMRDMQKS